MMQTKAKVYLGAGLLWGLVAIYSNVTYLQVKLGGHSDLSIVYNYYLQTKLEALKLLKEPKQPLPLGWKKVGNEFLKPSPSNEIICKLMEKEQETLLKCNASHDIYITVN